MGNTYCNYNWKDDKGALDLNDKTLPLRRPTATDDQTNITEIAYKEQNNKVEIIKHGNVSVDPSVAAAGGVG